jgi:hypothetical protein
VRISSNDSSLVAIPIVGQLLEQAEQFEHDYNNNDYSDDVEDVSVHAAD